MKHVFFLYILTFLTFLFAGAALAPDAVEMGVSAQTDFLPIGVATVGLGITIG
ncbi:hypothetical protein [Bdellovibrio sp. ZAP7]|uniref:hypothetical protein n=1 Tax=Bdellovibrio sp. ZAP7 TaxID=2231053 RepID=UPI00143CD117|nr:hypothetical protein [Bdellovibrio sp. ZAP7]